MLRTALGGAAVRLLFLGDGHRTVKASSAAADRLHASAAELAHQSSLSSLSLAQRESGWTLVAMPGPVSLRFAAHSGQSPAQSARQRIFAGAASGRRRAPTPRGRASHRARRGSRAPRPPPGRSTSRASTSICGAASARQRMHGPLSAASKRRLARSRRRACARPRVRPARARAPRHSARCLAPPDRSSPRVPGDDPHRRSGAVPQGRTRRSSQP